MACRAGHWPRHLSGSRILHSTIVYGECKFASQGYSLVALSHTHMHITHHIEVPENRSNEYVARHTIIETSF